jgi:hypothetical protein
MSLFILTETSAGYALLKAKDKKLFKHGLPEDANTAEGVSNLYVAFFSAMDEILVGRGRFADHAQNFCHERQRR